MCQTLAGSVTLSLRASGVRVCCRSQTASAQRLGPDGLFEILQLIFFQPPCQLRRLLRRIGPVGVDAQLQPTADRVAHAADHVEVFLHVRPGLGLEGAEALLDIPGGQLLGPLVGLDAHAGGQLDLAADDAAQEDGQRHTGRLAAHVPQGHLDTRFQPRLEGTVAVEAPG